MRFTVLIEPTNEPEHPGWYYAHIPVLDLTTHGLGVEGALEAARDMATGWIAELKASGTKIPVEGHGFVSQIEVPEDALQGS